MGGKWRILANIFANPDLPEIDDYYEPFDFEYAYLHHAPESEAAPTARAISIITGERMAKVEWGPNWEEILGGEFKKRSADYNFANFERAEKEIYGQFENTFLMYLPRLCERSEEHTSELQSLMRISYAVFCLKKKKKPQPPHTIITATQSRAQHAHDTII